MDNSQQRYAYLPDDLLNQVIDKASGTIKQIKSKAIIKQDQLGKARELMKARGLILKVPQDIQDKQSIMAADGACLVEHKAVADILLIIAAGVDGLAEKDNKQWPADAKQYQQWQAVLSHGAANERLAHGLMLLMELAILTASDRAIKMMDGSHITPLFKLDSMLNISEQETSDDYIQALQGFFQEYDYQVISDIPDMIDQAVTDPHIISIAKYSSACDLTETILKKIRLNTTDKVALSQILQANEYTRPFPVGNTNRSKVAWDQVSINCKLDLSVDNQTFNKKLEQAISVIKSAKQRLHFCYYKPNEYSDAYRIEIKPQLATDQDRLEACLFNIKEQIVSAEIREPYPQYMADLIVKNVYFAMQAVNIAIYNDHDLSNQQVANLIHAHRS